MNKVLLFSLSMFLAPAGAGAAANETVTLAVENMTCATCPITVRQALRRVPGVVKVEVDFDARAATVTFDPAQAKLKGLTRATTDAGYPSHRRR